MLSNFEQRVYNEYLRVTRSAVNKPFRQRKNFQDLDSSKELYVTKIARLLQKFANIRVYDFFYAPYAIYGVEDSFDLQFYASQRAIKTYTLFMQQEPEMDPDSDIVISRISDSLFFVRDFCLSSNINIDEYVSHKTNNFPSFLLHLKERTLSYYIMMELTGAVNIIRMLPADEIKFMFGDNFFANLSVYRSRYYNSTICKTMVKEGLCKIQNKLNKQQKIKT